MTFRVARHTTNLAAILAFYQDLLGLELLGKFQSHDNYDGVFLGFPNADWHLEFTVSNHQPTHQPDDDDLLVFYLDTMEAYHAATARVVAGGHVEVEPRNPYWKTWGTTFTDPDGFRVVLSPSREARAKA